MQHLYYYFHHGCLNTPLTATIMPPTCLPANYYQSIATVSHFFLLFVVLSLPHSMVTALGNKMLFIGPP